MASSGETDGDGPEDGDRAAMLRGGDTTAARLRGSSGERMSRRLSDSLQALADLAGGASAAAASEALAVDEASTTITGMPALEDLLDSRAAQLDTDRQGLVHVSSEEPPAPSSKVQ
jgi:hypothetical protein